MSFSVINHQPRPFGIVREPHLSENIWIKKVRKQTFQDELKDLQFVNEVHINRIIKKKGTIYNGDHSYEIYDEGGNHFLNAYEDSNCFCVHCCGPSRSYTVTIEDLRGKTLLKFKRPFRCNDNCWCCCGCGLMEMAVFDTVTEEHIGSIKQRWSLWREKFDLVHVEPIEDKEYSILGPKIACRCAKNIAFKICSENREAGEIWKRLKTSRNDKNEDHENFGVTYSYDMNIETRTLLLGAAFLLNHTFFEMS